MFEKKDLIIDYDGVIKDTIRVARIMMKELGINCKNEAEVSNFYKNLNWRCLLERSPLINDSVDCIIKIVNCGKFNPTIGTHTYSFSEGSDKTYDISKSNMPSIPIILIPKSVQKFSIFGDVTGKILVDDWVGNLVPWRKAGGIGVLFSQKLESEEGFPVIDRLDTLIDMDFEKPKQYKLVP